MFTKAYVYRGFMTYIRDTLSALLPIADKRSVNIFIVRIAEYGVFFFDYFVLGGGHHQWGGYLKFTE